METNFNDLPIGSVVRAKDRNGGKEYTVAGHAAEIDAYANEPRLTLKGGGWLYPSEIANVVSVPDWRDDFPAGTLVTVNDNPLDYAGVPYEIAGRHPNSDFLNLTNGGCASPYFKPEAKPTFVGVDTNSVLFDYNVAAIKLAIQEDDDVEFDYVDADGNESYGRYVEPQQVEGSLLQGWDYEAAFGEGAYRQFRIDRIEGRVTLV